MLYFIGLITPNPLRNRIQKLRLDIKKKYKSSHALNSPQHITLLSPFDVTKENISMVKRLLKDFIRDYHTFEVRLKDLSTFGNRVIFVDIIKDEPLMQLKADLEEFVRSHGEKFKYNYPKRPFHPHLTLAFKDLTPDHFDRAWSDLQDHNIRDTFQVNTLYLLKHNGKDKKWLLDDEFELEN